MTTELAPHVLVVEDDPRTARIVSNVLHEVDPAISIDVVRDGSECLAVLHGEDDSIPVPDIVLLDLDLLSVGGLTVLETRAEASMSVDPPVIVVSGEGDSETIVQCYDLGANTFFEKPEDLDGYLSLAESVVDHWLVHAELPTRHVAT